MISTAAALDFIVTGGIEFNGAESGNESFAQALFDLGIERRIDRVSFRAVAANFLCLFDTQAATESSKEEIEVKGATF